jgi:RHS repeat-associated protein
VGATNLTPLGFDAWGLRRKTTSANAFTQSLTTSDLASYQSPRGYTGHEHLDEVGLIHMNGRIYDPMIGRFLQPDPIISEPYNSQNFNRYSYVLNNPLMYTDPSGYSTWTQVRRPVVAIIVAVVAQAAAGAAMTAYADAVGETAFAAASETGTVLTAQGQAVAAAAGGFASGGVSGGNIQNAIAGAFQAVALFGVGEALGHSGEAFGGSTHVARIAAHATIGCVTSGVQGGSCGQGAASAGFAAFAGPVIQTEDFAAGLAGHAVAGGLGSMAAGGKFANGAITGTFGYLYNKLGGMKAVQKGAKGFAAFAQDIAGAGFEIEGAEVWGRTTSGERFRADGIAANKEGNILSRSTVVVCEVKCGPTADLSARQVRVYEAVNKGDFYLEGPKALELAKKLNLNVDANGKVTIPQGRFGGNFLGVYEGSAAHLKPGANKGGFNAIFGGMKMGGRGID